MTSPPRLLNGRLAEAEEAYRYEPSPANRRRIVKRWDALRETRSRRGERQEDLPVGDGPRSSPPVATTAEANASLLPCRRTGREDRGCRFGASNTWSGSLGGASKHGETVADSCKEKSRSQAPIGGTGSVPRVMTVVETVGSNWRITSGRGCGHRSPDLVCRPHRRDRHEGSGRAAVVRDVGLGLTNPGWVSARSIA
jgi:hypothetical protein